MEALEGVQTCTMGGEARMDGGDIIRLGDLFFVGRSSRTNDLGIVSLASLLEFFGHELRVIDIPDGALHLTSISSNANGQHHLGTGRFSQTRRFWCTP